MIDKYRINALTVFPGYNQARPGISSSGLIEWQPVQVTQAAKLVQIAGDTSGKKYRIKSKGYYDGGTKAIPANAYSIILRLVLSYLNITFFPSTM